MSYGDETTKRCEIAMLTLANKEIENKKIIIKNPSKKITDGTLTFLPITNNNVK